jgi:hypothetical protein
MKQCPTDIFLFWKLKKTNEEVVEEFEDFLGIALVQLESAVEGGSVVVVKVKIKTFEMLKTIVHTII